MKNININEQQFITNFTPESTYLLGLIWADGHLSSNTGNNQNRITINMVSVDIDKLTSIFNTTGKWHIYHRQRPNRQLQTMCVINSKPIYNWLILYNYRQRHIGTLLPNIIPEHLRHYWYLGLFDGDGCFYWHPKQYLRQMSIAGSYNQNWDFVSIILEQIKCKYKITRRIQYGHKSSIIRSSDKQSVTNFGQYIYQNYHKDNIGLQRKHDKFTLISK